MRIFGMGVVLALILGLSACGPVREGEVVGKNFLPAREETRTREVLKTDCGYYRKMGELTKQFGCGHGYFEETYRAHVLECHLISLQFEDDVTDWCVETGVWERAQVGTTYRTVPSDFRPGTAEEDL